MITLYVAEKPSMARDIAQVLGARKKEEGRWVGEGVWVSWCLGHLVELATPGEHDERWKSWRASALPILPTELLWVPSKRTRAHLKLLTGLLRRREVSRVVNACDAGREGELIFRTVYKHSGSRAPVQRFWVSSLTPAAIRAGLNNLKPSRDFDPLASAAYERAEADWLVGMNATRALTSRASDLLSVGRVQTPTLSLVVHRELELERFVPEDYWTLHAELEARSGERWSATWREALEDGAAQPSQVGAQTQDSAPNDEQRGRFKRLEDAERVAQRAREQVGHVLRCEGEERVTPPPMLLHLTALQQEANRRFGYSAEQTLSYAQALYERHKLLSYPRTDSRHLTPDVAATLPQALKALQGSGAGSLAQDAQKLNASALPKLGRRFVNAQRVTDHHALIPTSKTPNLSALSKQERDVYELVARSLLAALSPNAVDFVVTLDVALAGGLWRAKGRVERARGWREVIGAHKGDPKSDRKNNPKRDVEEEEQLLPRVEVGTPTRARAVEVKSAQTQPPKRYSEASLLGAMEHAGRALEARELKEALKGSGLGTPATRASILETLLKRGYITREGKSLTPTSAGRVLIEAISSLNSEASQALCSPELTARWEQQLQQIAEGSRSPEPFHREVRAWVSDLSAALTRGARINVPSQPKRGHSKNTTRAPKGSSAPQASWRSSSSPSSSSSSSSSSSPNPSSSSSPNPSSSSSSSSSPKRSSIPNTIIGLTCPRCSEGKMTRGQRGWGCDRWREGCHFVIWFILDGVEVPEDEALRVVARKQSRLFVEREGQRWRLCFDPDIPSGLRWAPNSPKGRSKTSARSSTPQKSSSRTSTYPSKGRSSAKGTSKSSSLGAARWKK